MARGVECWASLHSAQPTELRTHLTTPSTRTVLVSAPLARRPIPLVMTNARLLMPISGIGEAILQPIFEATIQVAGYITGRVVVPLFSLGRARVEPGKKGEWTRPAWRGVNRLPDGTWLLTAELGALMGLVFWFIVGGCYVVFKSAT